MIASTLCQTPLRTLPCENPMKVDGLDEWMGAGCERRAVVGILFENQPLLDTRTTTRCHVFVHCFYHPMFFYMWGALYMQGTFTRSSSMIKYSYNMLIYSCNKDSSSANCMPCTEIIVVSKTVSALQKNSMSGTTNFQKLWFGLCWWF